MISSNIRRIIDHTFSKKEPKIFEEKTEKNNQNEPLVLTDEIKEEEAPKAKTDKSESKTNTENQTLSIAC